MIRSKVWGSDVSMKKHKPTPVPHTPPATSAALLPKHASSLSQRGWCNGVARGWMSGGETAESTPLSNDGDNGGDYDGDETEPALL